MNMLLLTKTLTRPFCIRRRGDAVVAVAVAVQHQIRHHMNHGGGGGGGMSRTTSAAVASGPRTAVKLGLDAAKSTSNIVRLLESSHGFQVAAYDTFSTAWHPQGLLWRHDNDDNNNDTIQWKSFPAQSALDEGENMFPPRTTSTTGSILQEPAILSLSLSDHRTALVKLIGVDGITRFLSLLRFDSEFAPKTTRMGGSEGIIANDGWFIVREVVGTTTTTTTTTPSSFSLPNHRRIAFDSLHHTLDHYFDVEHGGGVQDRDMASAIFNHDASLLAIGMQPLDDNNNNNDSNNDAVSSEWSAPVGSLLEIPLSTYLDGVGSQTPHSDASKVHDTIQAVDMLPCGLAAAVTLTVGNGTQTNVYVDHLLLGRNSVTDMDWKILSKTFSPQPWP